LVGEFFEVRAQVDRDLTTVSRVDRRLGLIKNMGCHSFDQGGEQSGDTQEEAPQVEDDDVGTIQRQSQAPHPRLHQMVQRDHPVDNILGSIQRGVTTRSRLTNFCAFYSFVSSLEPLSVEQALGTRIGLLPWRKS
jgi:hypothetical protein